MLAYFRGRPVRHVHAIRCVEKGQAGWWINIFCVGRHCALNEGSHRFEPWQRHGGSDASEEVRRGRGERLIAGPP